MQKIYWLSGQYFSPYPNIVYKSLILDTENEKQSAKFETFKITI